MSNADVVGHSTTTTTFPAAVASAPAGWYDIGSGRRRWFDGRGWTDHYAPMPPETTVASSRRHPADHGFHLIMTVMTLCAWLPVWALAAGWSAARRTPHRTIRL